MYLPILFHLLVRIFAIMKLQKSELSAGNSTILLGQPREKVSNGFHGFFHPWFDGGDFPGGGGRFPSQFPFLFLLFPALPLIETERIEAGYDPLTVALKELNEEHYVAKEIMKFGPDEVFMQTVSPQKQNNNFLINVSILTTAFL